MSIRPYYSQSVRLGIRSIIYRVVPQTEDEIAAIRYLTKRAAAYDHAARMRSSAHGCAKAGAFPDSASAVPVAPAKADATDSSGGAA